MSSLDKRLEHEVSVILQAPWLVHHGHLIPTPESVAMAGGKVQCDGTVLYADMTQPLSYDSDFHQSTMVKVMKCFLRCCSLLIARNNGEVAGFDGNRVMGIFIGQDQVYRAVNSAFQINTMISDILTPRLNEYTRTARESAGNLTHCAGIDRGEFLALAGRPGSNELLWIGSPVRLAEELSSMRDERFRTVITETIYNALQQRQIPVREISSNLWEHRTFDDAGQTRTIYTSAARGVFESSSKKESAGPDRKSK
jgi:class 3 adenylate cyclase